MVVARRRELLKCLQKVHKGSIVVSRLDAQTVAYILYRFFFVLYNYGDCIANCDIFDQKVH